jgi:hypothetical protein
MPDIEPVDDLSSVEDIILKRAVTTQRLREQQPAFNQPTQDSLESIRNLVE